MVAFRKLFLVLAVLGLVGSFTASAQIVGQQPLQCTANAGVPPIVRAEGFTELTGDIVLTCTQSGGSPGNFLANFQIFLNTNITSRLLGSNLSEALLLIDEPGIPRTGGATPDFCVSPDEGSNDRTTIAGFEGIGGTAPACNPLTAGSTSQTGTYNTFRASRPSQGENSLVWPGIPVTPPASNNTRIFRFTNIRANAAGLGSSNTLIPTQIVAFISVSPSNTLAINNPQQTVAFIQNGIVFDVRSCSGGSVGSNANFSQCVAQNSALFTDPAGTGAQGAQFGVRFREGFQTAFKVRLDPGQVTGPTFQLPGQVFNSESGLVRPEAGLENVGIATQATRLAARFNNVPAGVRIFAAINGATVGGTTPSADTTTPGASAVLVATDANGAGGTTTGTGATVPVGVGSSTTLSCTGGVAAPAAEIAVTNGTGVAVWEITGANASAIDTLFFPVAVAFAANTANNLPGLGQSTVAGSFAPFYAATSGADRMSTSLPIPRFINTPISTNDFRIDQCVTNLLFPFVTNQAGFDTGIAISNTSRDPFANQSSRLQAGRCTLNYYGGTTGGGAAPAAQTTNANVEGGSQLTFVLSSGGNLGVAGTPGFQGYIIAQCGFQYAHGFAFVTDGPIGQARVAEGYLALILDAGIAARGSLSEVLGN